MWTTIVRSTSSVSGDGYKINKAGISDTELEIPALSFQNDPSTWTDDAIALIKAAASALIPAIALLGGIVLLVVPAPSEEVYKIRAEQAKVLFLVASGLGTGLLGESRRDRRDRRDR